MIIIIITIIIIIMYYYINYYMKWLMDDGPERHQTLKKTVAGRPGITETVGAESYKLCVDFVFCQQLPTHFSCALWLYIFCFFKELMKPETTVIGFCILLKGSPWTLLWGDIATDPLHPTTALWLTAPLYSATLARWTLAILSRTSPERKTWRKTCRHCICKQNVQCCRPATVPKGTRPAGFGQANGHWTPANANRAWEKDASCSRLTPWWTIPLP